MTSTWNVARGIGAVRISLAILIVVVCLLWLTLSRPVSAYDKCEFDGHPDVGPCDPDRGYIYDDGCYQDDGCYEKVERCCG